MKVKDLDRELKSLQNRLEKYGRYEGMFLNQKYYNLLSEVSNVRQRMIENDEDLKPHKVTGLIRRLRNIKKSRVTEYFSVYDPDTDRIYSPIVSPQEFILEKSPNIFKEKATDVINKVKSRHRKPKAEEYSPKQEAPEDEVYYAQEVLERIMQQCKDKGRTVWIELLKMIETLIATHGQDKVAKMFEEHANKYGVSGELSYDEATELIDSIMDWGWETLSLEDNKILTHALEQESDFGI